MKAGAGNTQTSAAVTAVTTPSATSTATAATTEPVKGTSGAPTPDSKGENAVTPKPGPEATPSKDKPDATIPKPDRRTIADPGEGKGDKPSTPPAESPTEADKPAEKAPEKKDEPPGKVVPEKYDLKLPEKTALSAAHLDGIATFARERGLSNEDAQAMVERENGLLQSHHENYVKAHVSGGDEWNRRLDHYEAAIKSDSVMGGEKYEETVRLATRAVTKHGNALLRQQLHDTGFGSAPELVRFFRNVGAAMGDDTLDGSSQDSVGGAGRAADRIYNGDAAKA